MVMSRGLTETTTKLVSSAVRIIGDNQGFEALLRDDRGLRELHIEFTPIG
jgi:hypothetical protein